VIILDTHVWLWLANEPEKLSRTALRAIDESSEVGISSISCWELARLASRGRIRLDRDPLDWIRYALQAPHFRLIDVSPEIAVEAAQLDWDHKDPADRMIVATAMVHGARLVSKDDWMRLYPPARVVW
jgi:PIN domain nuclease of toxin-antitoxin system